MHRTLRTMNIVGLILGRADSPRKALDVFITWNERDLRRGCTG